MKAEIIAAPRAALHTNTRAAWARPHCRSLTSSCKSGMGIQVRADTRNTLNEPALLRARDEHLRRLRQLFDGLAAAHAFVLCGVQGRGQTDLYQRPERWVEEALDDLAGRAGALRDESIFRPLSINPWPYGVHFVDKLLGAEVFELDGQRENWQAHGLAAPIGTLQPPDLAAQPAWALARRLATAFLQTETLVPLFAPPVLSSPLNIALNLYGQDFLVALLGDPAAARHDLRVITDTIKALHLWYQRAVPFAQLQMVETLGRVQPPGHGQLCGCSTQVLSPEQYGEFVAPLDDELLALYPGGGLIHLCGVHTQHLPVWRAMKSLCALQLNDRAAEDLPHYFQGLRDDQVLYVNPCAAMPVPRIMDITGGRRTVIVADVVPPLMTGVSRAGL